MSKFENLEQALCKELETLDQKFKSGMEMSTDDLRKVDMISHALKSLSAYEAMAEEPEGMSGYSSYERGQSSRRGRGANGRYVSRESREPDPMGGEFGYPFPEYSGRYYPPRW